MAPKLKNDLGNEQVTVQFLDNLESLVDSERRRVEQRIAELEDSESKEDRKVYVAAAEHREFVAGIPQQIQLARAALPNAQFAGNIARLFLPIIAESEKRRKQEEGSGPQTFRDLLSPAEHAEFEALQAEHPEWMPSQGLDTPATVRTVEENAAARAQFKGRGHHPHPLKFSGDPNPSDLVETGETRTQKNPTHTEITNFWNRVLRRINSEQDVSP